MTSPFLLEEIFGNTKPKRLIYGEHYFQIPPNADVMAIPFTSLPSVIKKKFHLLDCYINDSKAPHAIFVYPVLKRLFQANHRHRTVNGEHSKQTFSEENHRILSPITPNKPETEIEEEQSECFVPLRSCKEIASTILQLCQTSIDRRTSRHDENLMPNFRQSLLFNLRVVNIKASCLCMYKNGIYLLPEHKTDDPDKEAEEQQELNRNLENSTSRHMRTQDTLEINSYPEMRQPRDSPCVYLDDESISANGLLNPHQSIPENNQDEDRFCEAQFSPISSCSSQYEQFLEDMVPVKRKASPCDDIEDTKRRNSPSSSDSEMEYVSDISDISPISSIMDLQLPPETVPDVSPDGCPFLPSKESREITSFPSLNPLTSVESPIPPAAYSLQGWENSDARPLAPSSVVSISTGTLESMESDQSESSESSSLSQSLASTEEDRIPPLLEQDETTKDEIIQRLQQRVKECQETVENMRNKK
ncbi:uncharacterized protein [Hyperolius riggenbachi]|uniref:uncharacterized protein n=1 Tax=Hyperolius riggenbachi TaxID=752182 RepID=UPI0035A380C6